MCPSDFRFPASDFCARSAHPRLRVFACATTATVFIAIAVCGISPVRAADPQPYDVTIGKTGFSDLNDTLQASSLLLSLREKSPVGSFALIGRAKEDADRFETVLQSFGYYHAQVDIQIDHYRIWESNLPAILDAVPKGTPVPVDVKLTLGPLYTVRRVTIDGKVPADVGTQLDIKPGDPAVAAKVLGASGDFLTALQEHGYALAKVDPPLATEDDAAHAIDVTYNVTAGPKAEIGTIAIKGLRDVHEEFVRKALTVHPGQLYQPSKIEAARQNLLALGVFSGADVRAADHLDANGRIPVTFQLQERPKHAVTFSGAYSTDLGLSLSASWSDRNLLGDGQQLNLSAAGTELGGTATTGLGYNILAQYIVPMFPARKTDLEFDLSGIKQAYLAYNQTAETVSGFLRRKLSPEWKGSLGLSVTEDQIGQEGINRSYQLLALPVSATFDSTGLTDLLQDPTQGIRASLAVTPTRSFGRAGSDFVILVASASTYFDLGVSGSSVIALRGLVGSALGAAQFDLPPDERLYAGGSATIRGYKYQTVGPLFPDGNPIGGTSLDAATVEFRQKLFGDFRGAVFVDAGQAGAQPAPFAGTVRVGAGAGVRYYTAIGAVRLDVAVPVTPIPGGDAFELYIGLGQAF